MTGDDEAAAPLHPLRLHPAPGSTHRNGVAEFDIRRTRRPQSHARNPLRKMDAETVIARLEEAGHTLLSLPRTGDTRHRSLAEALGAFAAAESGRTQPPAPTPSRITRMDQALAWIPLIPADRLALRRIVGCRSLVSPLTGRHLFSWRRLARLLGADHQMVQRWHATGIRYIMTALNRDAALVRSWDRLR